MEKSAGVGRGELTREQFFKYLNAGKHSQAHAFALEDVEGIYTEHVARQIDAMCEEGESPPDPIGVNQRPPMLSRSEGRTRHA